MLRSSRRPPCKSPWPSGRRGPWWGVAKKYKGLLLKFGRPWSRQRRSRGFWLGALKRRSNSVLTSITKQTQRRPKSGSKIYFMNSFHFREGWKHYTSFSLRISNFRFRLERIACAYSSARSIGYCAIWVCTSLSSVFESSLIIIAHNYPVFVVWTLVVHALVWTSFDNGNNYTHVKGDF